MSAIDDTAWLKKANHLKRLREEQSSIIPIEQALNDGNFDKAAIIMGRPPTVAEVESQTILSTPNIVQAIEKKEAKIAKDNKALANAITDTYLSKAKAEKSAAKETAMAEAKEAKAKKAAAAAKAKPTGTTYTTAAKPTGTSYKTYKPEPSMPEAKAKASSLDDPIPHAKPPPSKLVLPKTYTAAAAADPITIMPKLKSTDPADVDKWVREVVDYELKTRGISDKISVDDLTQRMHKIPGVFYVKGRGRDYNVHQAALKIAENARVTLKRELADVMPSATPPPGGVASNVLHPRTRSTSKEEKASGTGLGPMAGLMAMKKVALIARARELGLKASRHLTKPQLIERLMALNEASGSGILETEDGTSEVLTSSAITNVISGTPATAYEKAMRRSLMDHKADSKMVKAVKRAEAAAGNQAY